MTRFLFAALLVACCGTAAAQTVTVSQDTGETETMQTSAAETTPAQTEEPARTCLRSTGSRIVASRNLRAEKDRKPQGCAVAAGRVYTAEDLDRSGHMNLADALRSLDTSIR
jgi:hypothetical protein